MTPDQSIPRTLGAILAGGRARRFGGGDKVLRRVGDRRIMDRLIDRLTPQVTRLVINVNGDSNRFDGFGLPVVADGLADHQGPLAGLLAVLEWIAAADPAIEWVLTVPGDAPFVPRDLVRRLHAGRNRDKAVMACAASGGRTHPVVALWPVTLLGQLRQAVAAEGVRKVDAFRQRFPCSVLEWPTDPADPFFNINSPEDLTTADQLVAAHPWL